MKKRLTKIIVAILVFAFVVGIAPTNVVADLFNTVVSAAETYNLRKVNGAWYYFNDDGNYDRSYVGLAKNEYGWWYVEDGKIDFTFTGMAKNKWGWWHVKNGKLDLTYTGLDTNQYGTWYMKNGKLDLTFNGMAKDSGGWRYVKNGKADENYTGLAKNQWGWWYFRSGRIDYIYRGLAKNDYGWWYVNNGKIDQTYNGIARNEYGAWNVVNGKVVSKATESDVSATDGGKEAGTLGFLWDDRSEVFYSANDPWQREWGYNAFYDWAAQLIVLYYDTVRFKFNYGGYDWLIQLWKGQYGFVLIGAEVGIYYKEEGKLLEHYICEDNSMRLKVGYICYDHNAFLFKRDYQDTWWLTGFVPGKLDRLDDRSEMALQCLITLKTPEMRDKFVEAIERKGFTYGRATVDEPDTYFTSGTKDVYLYWQYITEM